MWANDLNKGDIVTRYACQTHIFDRDWTFSPPIFKTFEKDLFKKKKYNDIHYSLCLIERNVIQFLKIDLVKIGSKLLELESRHLQCMKCKWPRDLVVDATLPILELDLDIKDTTSDQIWWGSDDGIISILVLFQNWFSSKNEKWNTIYQPVLK